MLLRWIHSAAILILLAGCAQSFEAKPDAVLLTRPDAPGFLVMGLANETARYGLTGATLAISVKLDRAGGGVASMTRYGCGSIPGLYGSKPCDLTKLERQVLQLQPGEWSLSNVVESLSVIGGNKLLRDQLPPGHAVRVGPGEVVYIGDFILASDYDAQAISLRRHDRDDAAATLTLAGFPGLSNAPVLYRDPVRSQ